VQALPAKQAELAFQLTHGIHVAYAEVLADVFITCDDKLLKRCQKESSLKHRDESTSICFI
jgi:hypothetical protein